jgi:hypothetical protein
MPVESCRLPTMKAFFCHASEDKPAVEQVLARVTSAYPEVAVWIDKYEIVAGEDLISKIAQGIEDADKFFVFLSEQSINKPWVTAELRKALIHEIDGVKPDFIVPVKLGSISKFPPFIESKKYIDLERQTETEWLAEFHRALTGAAGAQAVEHQDNLEITLAPLTDDSDGVAVVFRARYWAETVGFLVTTTVDIVRRNYQFIPALPGAHSSAVKEGLREYGVYVQGERLSGERSFAIAVTFPPGADLSNAIASAGPWDGAGSTGSGIWF